MLLSFQQFIAQPLQEALITFGGKAYPKFGNIVILAGGAGSGKGFIKDKLLGIEGYNFDVDELKSLVIRSTRYAASAKAKIGVDVKTLNLKRPDDVGTLHTVVSDVLGADRKRKEGLYSAIATASADKKPNLIFDVTLSSLSKLKTIVAEAKALGYLPQNIHLVWVVNDIEIAKEQNEKRARVVPEYILVSTHAGAATTLKAIIGDVESLRSGLDGDIVFAFNKAKVDSTVEKSGRGGSVIKSANYIYLKKAGHPMSDNVINQEIQKKIAAYVPSGTGWG